MNITENVRIGIYNHKVERSTETYDVENQIIKVVQIGNQE